MAKVTPNIASTVVPGVISKKVAMNPNKSIAGVTSQFAGFNPEQTSGDTARGLSGDHFAARNAQGGHKVFTNEAKRPSTDALDQVFYGHIE